MKQPIRVFIVGDPIAARLALRAVLILNAAIQVVGEAINGAETISVLSQLQPDVVLLDLRLPIAQSLTILILCSMLLFSSACGNVAQTGPLHTKSRTVELGGTETVNVTLTISAGTLRVTGSAAPSPGQCHLPQSLGREASRLAAHQKLLAEWTVHKELLEAELVQQIPEMNLERALRAVDRQTIAQALPEHTALVGIRAVRHLRLQGRPSPARAAMAAAALPRLCPPSLGERTCSFRRMATCPVFPLKHCLQTMAVVSLMTITLAISVM